MKVLVLSSLAQDAGCWLRAQYLGESLKKYCKVEYIKPFKKTMPFMLDLVLSLPVNLFKILFKKTDITIAIKPFPNVTWPLLVKKLFGTKVIVDIDDLDYGYRKGFLAEISKLAQRPFPKYFDLVTYHNNNLRKHIVENLKVKEEKMYKLDQGVDFNVFNYKIKDEELKGKFKGKKVLLYTGHLNIASDLDEIFKAIKLLKIKDFVFIVAGGGHLEDKFKELAKKLNLENVIFTGYLKKEDIARYISIADICLVYYKDILVNYYRCSMKLRECLAMGKKVVCNDVGDLKEFKDFTYQSKTNLERFNRKIIEALNANDNKAKKGKKYINKNYNWEKIGKEFSEKLINNFINE